MSVIPMWILEDGDYVFATQRGYGNFKDGSSLAEKSSQAKRRSRL